MHDAVLKHTMGTLQAEPPHERKQHHFGTWARMPDLLGNASAAELQKGQPCKIP